MVILIIKLFWVQNKNWESFQQNNLIISSVYSIIYNSLLIHSADCIIYSEDPILDCIYISMYIYLLNIFGPNLKLIEFDLWNIYNINWDNLNSINALELYYDN